ncbi:MAG: DUF2304 domain-containing protein [Lewinellaceae bacterium]|nr:DUF2304 domain-containing protein [Saprospiraceae bacterium]MCB9342035.1 DUF2304 domain-containing protein [Lewinellaceae bacterium]
MQTEIYQWLVPIIGVFYIGRTIYQFRKNKRGLTSTLVWVIFWITVMLLAIIPNPVSFEIANLLGFKSNINAVIFVALGWLFLLVFYLSTTIDRLERKLTELVRKIAMDEQGKEKKDRHENQKK